MLEGQIVNIGCYKYLHMTSQIFIGICIRKYTSTRAHCVQTGALIRLPAAPCLEWSLPALDVVAATHEQSSAIRRRSQLGRKSDIANSQLVSYAPIQTLWPVNRTADSSSNKLCNNSMHVCEYLCCNVIICS